MSLIRWLSWFFGFRNMNRPSVEKNTRVHKEFDELQSHLEDLSCSLKERRRDH